ncbi:MAG: hypothetical protein RL095_1887 [Verrucomicrobiota bacterium]|jgi:aerotaxis receptor
MRPSIRPIDREKLLDTGDFIVSKTDPKGIITYVNRVFLEISGYSENELLGQPHNMIRHPDMPKAAFKDLWTTIKAGKEWRGIVKNLCKDGSYYWVDAYVVPILEKGSITGYTSMRRRPTEAQVNAVLPLYRQWLAEEVR